MVSWALSNPLRLIGGGLTTLGSIAALAGEMLASGVGIRPGVVQEWGWLHLGILGGTRAWHTLR